MNDKFIKVFIFLNITISFLCPSDPALFAQNCLQLPEPGRRIALSPEFDPPIFKGIKIHPDNPLRLEFILNNAGRNPAEIKDIAKLIKYFLASLTIPEDDLWVNLSPYEQNRIIPPAFGRTEMGRDLLIEDYMLKQITASLIYPEGETGKKFWKKVYAEAAKRFGTTDIAVNTFNKVWIVPDKAVVYENAKAGTAYVVESTLKVMLEEDYLSQAKHGDVGVLQNGDCPVNIVSQGTVPILRGSNIHMLGSQMIREIVIPELTKEVNTGANFAKLRQVYNSLILATWYKKKIKDSILTAVYANQNKIQGITITTPGVVMVIYHRYLQAFKKGVYNYIKEEPDPVTLQAVPRKYFSGGFALKVDAAMRTVEDFKPGDFRPDDYVHDQLITAELRRAEAQTKGERKKIRATVRWLTEETKGMIEYHIMPQYGGVKDAWKAFVRRNDLDPSIGFVPSLERKTWKPLMNALGTAISLGREDQYQRKYMGFNTGWFKAMRKKIAEDLVTHGYVIHPIISLMSSVLISGTHKSHDERVDAVRQALRDVQTIHLLNDAYDPSKPLKIFVRGLLEGSTSSFGGMFEAMKDKYNIGVFEYNEFADILTTSQRFDEQLALFLSRHGLLTAHGLKAPYHVIAFSNGTTVFRLAFLQTHQTRKYQGLFYDEIAPPLGGSAKADQLRYYFVRNVVVPSTIFLHKRVAYSQNPHGKIQKMIVADNARFRAALGGYHLYLVENDHHNPGKYSSPALRKQFEELKKDVNITILSGIEHNEAPKQRQVMEGVEAGYLKMVNAAMTGRDGGIDLRPVKVMAFDKASAAIQVKMDPAQLALWQSSQGVDFDIINIRPLGDLQNFLGVKHQGPV